MSKLLNPGVGDICDRLTILALKRHHAEEAGKPTDHFDREWAGLHTQIRSRTLNAAWFEKVLELSAINAALWAATDQMAAAVEAYTHTRIAEAHTALLGIRIYQLNEERAQLVQGINELTGEHQGEEKV